MHYIIAIIAPLIILLVFWFLCRGEAECRHERRYTALEEKRQNLDNQIQPLNALHKRLTTRRNDPLLTLTAQEKKDLQIRIASNKKILRSLVDRRDRINEKIRLHLAIRPHLGAKTRTATRFSRRLQPLLI